MARLVHIYVDGSCRDVTQTKMGGWAAVLVDVKTGTRKEIAGQESGTTSQRMELMAACRALEALKTVPCNAVVHSDSLYVVNAGNRTIQRPVKNLDLLERLRQVADRHNVVFQHIPAHSGYTDNERADELAGKAMRGE